MFQRSPMKKGMEGDFETGNVRYKVRERYSFGATDWRGVFGSPLSFCLDVLYVFEEGHHISFVDRLPPS